MAAIATALIAVVYVGVVATLDVLVFQHLRAQVDVNLAHRLAEAPRLPVPGPASSPADPDHDHDVDEVPVFLWLVPADGKTAALTPGAPTLPARSWARSAPLLTARVGTSTFRFMTAEVGGSRFVAGQSLAETSHVEGVLEASEALAAPLVLLAVFFGALAIGVRAARPVERSRLRQLEFTADASHELRTPLSVIEAEVGLARQSRRSQAHYEDTLDRIGDESRRLRSIVEDLLWLARFDAEPPPPGHEPIDLSAIAEGCADRFGAVAAARGIGLSVRRPKGRPAWITAPPEWIDRLVGVLVDNACRYAGEDGTVRITVGTGGHRALLVVEDSGPGIPPGERDRLFDRFHRATAEGSGHGLGLAIADSVSRSTGGRWRIGEAEAGGARMEVSWPLA